MESNIALVYMTLNMIYYIIFIINLYYHKFNNFLLTRQRLKRLSFFFFVCSSSCERTHSFPNSFPNCKAFAAPSPNPKTPGPRASASPTTPIAKCLSCLLVWINPGSYFNQFLMPKVLIAPNS